MTGKSGKYGPEVDDKGDEKVNKFYEKGKKIFPRTIVEKGDSYFGRIAHSS
jgi:hypothetical protein